MPEESTFYERIKKRWENNRAVAITVFIVATVLTGVTIYQKVAGFVTDLVDNSAEITAFNTNVQPIYFQGRSARLVGDDCTPVDNIAAAIIKLSPQHVLVRSHTSRITISINGPLTLERGTFIANALHARMNGQYQGRIVVISYGGAQTSEDEGDYRERVEVFLSNDASVLAGEEIIAPNIPTGWVQGDPDPFGEIVNLSPCLGQVW